MTRRGAFAPLLLAISLAAGGAAAAHLERVTGIVQFASLEGGYLVVDSVRHELEAEAYVIDARGNPVDWSRVRPGALVTLTAGKDGVMEIMLVEREDRR